MGGDDKDDIELWLRRWYNSQYISWKRKVDAVDPLSAYKAAADRIDRALGHRVPEVDTVRVQDKDAPHAPTEKPPA